MLFGCKSEPMYCRAKHWKCFIPHLKVRRDDSPVEFLYKLNTVDVRSAWPIKQPNCLKTASGPSIQGYSLKKYKTDLTVWVNGLTSSRNIYHAHKIKGLLIKIYKSFRLTLSLVPYFWSHWGIDPRDNRSAEQLCFPGICCTQILSLYFLLNYSIAAKSLNPSPARHRLFFN